MDKDTFDRHVKPLNLKKSMEMFAEANKVTPGGAVGIRKPERAIFGEYPIFIKEAKKDMNIIDEDGNQYIDYLCGWGPIVLDFVNDEINYAVMERIKKGFCFSYIQQDKLRLEKLLQKIIPCCEKSIITKTGSDATSIALKLARAYTGKSKVISWGYHGWHDWCTYEYKFHDKGVPKQVLDLTVVIPWGNLEMIEKTLKEDKDIAAIFTTPISHELFEPLHGSKKYLKELRRLADTYNVVLIFDEIRTGFRMAMGGAQEYYNVLPDIACFGKAMANGYAISAVCGKKEIMDMGISNVAISSTFFPNSLEIIAALKTIEIIERENVINEINQKSIYFKNTCDSVMPKYKKVRAQYVGLPGMPFILFDKEQDKMEEKRDYFYRYLVRKGIMLHPSHHGYISYNHNKKDLDYTLNTIEECLSFLDQNYQ